MRDLTPTVFRGFDRRTCDDTALGRRTWLFGTGLSALVLLAFVPATLRPHSSISSTGGRPVTVGTGSIAAFAALAAAAGTILFVAWWVSGRAKAAWVAAALLPSALLAGPLAELAQRATVGDAPAWAPAALAAALAGIVAGLLLLIGARRPEVDSALRPVRLVVVALSGTLAAAGLLTALVHWTSVPALSPSVIAGLALAGALGWWAAGVTVARHATRRPLLGPLADPPLVLACFALGLAGLDNVLAGVTGRSAFPLGARLVTAAGWSLALACALLCLQRALQAARSRQQRLRRDRDLVTAGLERTRRDIEENRHDLRSLVAGIRGASATLSLYRDLLPDDEVHDLQAAMLAEIERLNDTIGMPPLTRHDLHLREVIDPVVTAERALGAVITVRVPDVVVHASPTATAEILQNLLVNARRHAPGARIEVGAAQRADEVLVWVADDGPGIATGQREQRGIGLAASARLAHEQGGELRVAAVARGTRVEFSVPLAADRPFVPAQRDRVAGP